MKPFIRKIPIPLCGLALGLASIGNLLATYSTYLKAACGFAAAGFLLMVLTKVVLFPAVIWESLQEPITASVSGTFSMSLMILSAYLAYFSKTAACFLWALGIAVHMLLIFWFSWKFMRRVKLQEIFASFYVVYVGIGAAAITAPAHHQNAIGSVFLYFSLAAFLALSIPITLRYIKYPAVPEPARPLFCIAAAPANLCLAGYLSCISEKSVLLTALLYSTGFLCYLAALKVLIACRKLPFYPSYAAFTFPFVINAIATEKTAAFLYGSGPKPLFFTLAANIELLIAVCLVSYVLYCYIRFLFGQPSLTRIK